MGPTSPMTAVESKLVELIIRMSRICRCLTATQYLLLANDLVEGTKYDHEVIAFKENNTEESHQLTAFKLCGIGVPYSQPPN